MITYARFALPPFTAMHSGNTSTVPRFGSVSCSGMTPGGRTSPALPGRNATACPLFAGFVVLPGMVRTCVLAPPNSNRLLLNSRRRHLLQFHSPHVAVKHRSAVHEQYK